MAMPKVNRERLNSITTGFSQEEKDIINLIVKKNDQVRATKPKVKDSEPITGKAAYVWRMVAFIVSTKPQHHCMPVTADFDLPAYDENGKWSYTLTRPMVDDLKKLEDAIVNSISPLEWHGANRWGKAMGML